MRKIKDNLYVGGLSATKKSEGVEFDRVISLHMGTQETTHSLPMFDGEHNYGTFEEAADVAVEGLENDEVVLIHSNEGVSRSVAVATSALFRSEDDIGLYEPLKECRVSKEKVPDQMLLESVVRYASQNE